MGTNSGPYNQITTKFTECAVEYTIDYRIHPFANPDAVIGYFHVMDFNSNALGMNIYTDQFSDNINGVMPFSYSPTRPNDWELVNGALGSIVSSYSYETDIPLTMGTPSDSTVSPGTGFVDSYYDDRGSFPLHSCTNNYTINNGCNVIDDGKAYGSLGFRFGVAYDVCTDWKYPDSRCPANPQFFRGTRTDYYLGDSLSVTQAIQYDELIDNPIEVCSQILSINDVPVVPGTYNAVDHINSIGTVIRNSSISYKAGSYIELNQDFSVEVDADFEALIEDCIN